METHRSMRRFLLRGNDLSKSFPPFQASLDFDEEDSNETTYTQVVYIGRGSRGSIVVFWL